ncbi:MAG TPA: tyrosine-type recombinase/integrase [Actinomycetes bacterium]|nr:tyrosine-type recombinase/integrase [Actinomycetes bacterium]
MIRKRRDGLQVQVYAGRDPLTGRKRWASRQVPGQTKQSQREAKKVEAQLLEEVDRGQHRGERSRTVGELVERWLEWRQHVRPISPVSVANYRGAIDRYILPALGTAKVRQVDAATLDALYAQVTRHGGKCRHCWTRIRRGQAPLRAGERYRPRPGAAQQVHEPDCVRGWPLSAPTAQQVHKVLSGAFKQAVVWGWTTHNPARQATRPAGAKAEVAPPEARDVARLLTAALQQDPELGLFLRLAVVLGARRGELVGLKWRDVDLNAGQVLIASGVVRLAGRPLLDKDTKTHAKRRVAVGAETVELLRAHRARQAAAALACGASLPPDAYVFSRAADASTPISPDGVSHRFQQLAAHLGVHCRLHDLRHFMVTQLVAGGVDWRTVSGRAGHADGHMTLGTYAHFQQAQDRHAAEFMDELLVAAATDSR